jgi:hypothetical protein
VRSNSCVCGDLIIGRRVCHATWMDKTEEIVVEAVEAGLRSDSSKI